jgi:hypothetical protein
MTSLVDLPTEVTSDDDAQVLFREARRRRRRRRVALVAAVTVAGVASYLAFSGGGSSSTSAPAGQGARAPVPRQARTVGTTSCARADLRVSVTPAGSALGNTYVQMAFKNTGSVLCSVAGVPEIRFTGRKGQPVGYTVASHIEEDTGRSPAIVRLAPRHSAAFLLQIQTTAGFTSPRTQCRFKLTKLMLIKLHPWSRPTTIPWSGPICTVTPAVYPVTYLHLIRDKHEPA